MIPRFPCIIQDGKLVLDNPESFKEYLRGVKGKHFLSLKKETKIRSSPQNKYLWGVVIPIVGKELGYTPEETHEALKWEFLKVDGLIPKVRSTADLTTVEFEAYLDQIKIWAATFLGVYIPDPNQVDYEKDPIHHPL